MRGTTFHAQRCISSENSHCEVSPQRRRSTFEAIQKLHWDTARHMIIGRLGGVWQAFGVGIEKAFPVTIIPDNRYI